MAGASFVAGDTLSGDLSHAVESARLGGTALIVGTVVVLGLALLGAYADRCITAARQDKEQAFRYSEARLRAILEAALDCIITIDQAGRIVEFNPAAERTFGYRRAEVIGKEMAALMIPPALREGHRRSLATGEGPLLDGRREIRVLRADGAEIPAEIAVTRIGVEGPPLFTAYLRDITDQKAAQQALESTGARLQHLLASSPTVIYSTAATGDYACSFISENLLELIGYQAAEYLNDNDKDFWLERVHPDDKTRVLAEFEDTVRRERGAFEYRFLHKDGGYRWIHDSYRLTRGTEGQPLEIIGSWIDITARKEAEDALGAARDEALRANLAKSELLSCTVSATPVSFGSYNVFNASPLDATGTITVHCTGLVGLLVSYNIKLSTGLSGSYAPRQMANGANRLNYNLYTDATRLTVWGNGSAGTSFVSNSILLVLLGVTVNHTIYGRVPALQNVAVGSYSDNMTVTLTF